MKNRIRALRKARGWTLADLAAHIGPEQPTPQTIARLETGTRTLSITWLERIARALEVSPQELLTLSKGPSSPIVATLGKTGLTAVKVPPEIDLTVIAEDPVAIEFETTKGRYSAGDILVFDRLEHSEVQFLDEALVKTQSGEILFGSLFPAGPDRHAMLASPAPHASLHSITKPQWIARAVCLTRRLDMI
ncbi:MAG: helix-turn-helix transcriptional regulator [Pseudomonadota bacterium]